MGREFELLCNNTKLYAYGYVVTKPCVRIWHQKAGAINPLIPGCYVVMTLLSAGAL